MILLQLQHKL